MHPSSASHHLPLHAVLTGEAEVVRTLGAWAKLAGHPLSLDTRWGSYLTAPHVAALLREPEEVALALTGVCQWQQK